MMKYKLLFLLLLLTTIGKAENISGTWTGLLEVGQTKLHVVFHLQKDAQGTDVCFMDSPDQSVKGIPTQLLFISPDSLSIAVPAIGARYDGKLLAGKINGTYAQMGVQVPLNLEKKSLTYNRPQHPVGPFPYVTEEVGFTNVADSVTLAGTLTYPVGYKEGDSVPVVLMVSGSGPENRDSEIYEHKPFLVIADYLARNGIATLRYDDRAVGKSTGKYQAMTTKVVADDARAGMDYLRDLKLFSKVGILGHSEGATVAFMLGAEKLPDFVISMAGLGVNGADCLYAQSKKITGLSGQPFNMDKDQYLKMVQNMHNPWLEYFVNYNPQSDIQGTECPVFALNGDKDVQVIASLNLTGIEQNLQKNDKSKTKLYPGLNHLFQECNTGLPTEYTSLEQTISPVVLKDLVEWIKNL